MQRSDGKFKCRNCDFKSKFITSVTRHEAAVHKGITYNCDLCEYTAKQKGSIETHKRGQHGGEHFKCEQCDYKSRYKSAWRLHRKTHFQVKYSCELCDYAAISRPNLNSHIDSKHEGTIHQCHLCSDRFNLLQNLKRHLKTNHLQYHVE